MTINETLGPPAVAPAEQLRDVQPILERSRESIWAHVEKLRDELCEQLQRTCEQRGYEALAVKSAPFVQPAWVKLECWLPRDGRRVTARKSAVVTIEAKEFHRYDVEYSVELHDGHWSKTYRGLRAPEEGDAVALADFVLGLANAPKLGRLQLRKGSLDFWRPRNKLDVLRTRELFGGVRMLLALRRRRALVRSSGKPEAEPRNLIRVDSWQAVVGGLGRDAELLRTRLLARIDPPPIDGLRSWVEHIWYWGLDGKVERLQNVMTLRRAWLFCQIYAYDDELYVGWDAHLNCGQWVEKTVATGRDKSTGELTQVNTVVAGSQPLTEYDVVDVNCLTEWTHARIVQLLQRLMEERKIDQEIDFTIIRGDRPSVGEAAVEAPRPKSGPRAAVQRRLHRAA